MKILTAVVLGVFLMRNHGLLEMVLTALAIYLLLACIL